MPGPSSQGGLSGREWERIVERHVLNLDRQWQQHQQGVAAGTVASLHELVMRSLGSRHWTTRRLAQMMDD